MENDGRMTEAQKDRLLQWQLREVDGLFERAMESDLVFCSWVNALDRSAELNLDLFTADILSDAARFKAGGYSQNEWLASSEDLPGFLSEQGIPLDDAGLYLKDTIAFLKDLDLWPW